MNDLDKAIESDGNLKSLDSVEDTSYSVKANLKVDDYYKNTDLRGIEIRDAKKIKEIADKQKNWIGIFKEISLGIATTLLGLALGNFTKEFSWESAIDVIYFFVPLFFSALFASAYIVLCLIKHNDSSKLQDALQDHLFVPLGLEEDENNGK